MHGVVTSSGRLASVRGLLALLAALSLGRRLHQAGPPPERIQGPRDAIRLLAHRQLRRRRQRVVDDEAAGVREDGAQHAAGRLHFKRTMEV